MNILFVSPEPPNHLNRIRTLNLLKALSGDHQVHLVYLSTSDSQYDSFHTTWCHKITAVSHPKWRSYLNCLLRFLLPEPLEVAYCYSPLLKQTIADILCRESIDIVYVKRTRMASYGLNLPRPIPTLLDLTDSMELHYGRTVKTVQWHQKPLYIEEGFKYRLYERQIVSRYNLNIVCSQVDKIFIEQHTGATNLAVVPNIVDIDFFAASLIEPDANTILFSGLMNKQVNIDAAKFLLENIYPHLHQQNPAIRLFIVGPEPPTEILRYAQRDPHIIVTGYVADIREYIARSAVVVVPVQVGAGTRNKILQAMAMQRPVVSTTIGAEGLDGLTDEQITIANDPKEFAARVLDLLADKAMRQQKGQAGRQFVEKYYSMAALKQSLAATFARIQK